MEKPEVDAIRNMLEALPTIEGELFAKIIEEDCV